MRSRLLVFAVLVPLLGSLSVNGENGPIDVNVELQSEDIEAIDRQSSMSYRGVHSKKVGKRTYKCTLTIKYSLSPPKCTKSTANCKPLPHKPITFTIDKIAAVAAVLTVTVHKKKVKSCSVAPTKPTPPTPTTPATPTTPTTPTTPATTTTPTTPGPSSELVENLARRVSELEASNKILKADLQSKCDTTKCDANTAALDTKCDATTCSNTQTTVTDIGTCLGDVSSSDCPSSPSGKTGLAAALDDKCDATTCEALETCLGDVSSSDCPLSPNGKTGLAAALADKCDVSSCNVLSTSGPSVFLFLGGDDSKPEEIYHPNNDIDCTKSPPKIPNGYQFIDHVTFEYKNVVYLCGGLAANVRNICISKDLTEDSTDWQTYDNTEYGSYSSSAIVMKNYVYIIGGTRKVNNNEFPANNIWSQLPLLHPTPKFNQVPNFPSPGRGSCLVKIDDDSFLAIGGDAGQTSVTKYSINGESSTSLTPLPKKRTWAGCSKVEKEGKVWIVIAGGYDWDSKPNNVLSTSAKLDLEDGNEWKPLGNLNVPRYKSQMVSTDYGLMMLGSAGGIDTVEVFNWETEKWNLHNPSLKSFRHTMEATVHVSASLFNCR